MGSCIQAPCTAVGRDDFPLHVSPVSSSAPAVSAQLPSINTNRPAALPGCLSVSLPEVWRISSLWVVTADFSFLLISLSCHLPDFSLHTLSLPYSSYLCSFCSVFFLSFSLSRFLPLSLCPCLPGCLQPRGLTSWPGRRICQHIFSGLAVRNVRHRL